MIQMTLAEHAEAWWLEQGMIVPDRNSQGWHDMYEKWISFAFENLHEEN
jgi:hypothetical protein